MSRFRYRSERGEIGAFKAAVLRIVKQRPMSHAGICTEVAEKFPVLTEEDAFWRDKVTTACQYLRKEGKLELTRLAGGPGKAWRGWKRANSREE